LAGVADWSAGSNIVLADNAAINVQSSGLLLIESDQSVVGAGTLANGGSIIKLNSAGTTFIAAGVSFTSTNFLWLISGTVAVGNGIYNQLNGAVTALEVGTVLAANVTLQSGSVLQGSGAIVGDLINNGVLLVGNGSSSFTGTMIVTGNYTQLATGVLI